MRVLIAGGGTAGHVYPGLALAGVLRARGHEVSFAGTQTGLEARLVPAAGFPLHVTRARPLTRAVSYASLRAPVVALRDVGRCRSFCRGADVVVGTGGYVSVPTVLAAYVEGVPVVLHEQNAIPGLANRSLARLASAVALSFAGAAAAFPRRPSPVVTGNPVREPILRVVEDRDVLAKEAYEELELVPGRKTVVIFGGSQGALHLDRAAVGACSLLSDRTDLQIVVATGPAHLETVRRGLPEAGPTGPRGLRVRLIGYLDRMELAYSCADLVVARAGATSIAEITDCGLPALLVPYPYATGGHQEANARALQRAGGASVISDALVSARTLAERVMALVEHEERRAAMIDGARSFARRDAAQRLGDLVLRAGGRP